MQTFIRKILSVMGFLVFGVMASAFLEPASNWDFAEKKISHENMREEVKPFRDLLKEWGKCREANYDAAEQEMRAALSAVAGNVGAIEKVLSTVVPTKDSRLRNLTSRKLSALATRIIEQRKWLDKRRP